MVRRWFLQAALISVVALLALSWWWPPVAWAVVALGPLILIGLRDSFLTRRGDTARSRPTRR